MLSLVLLAAIAAVASSAHAGICVGASVGCGILRVRQAAVVYTSMIIAGALIEGFMMRRAVFNTSVCVLATTIAMSVLPSLSGIPLSLNFGLYTSQIGCAIARQGTYIIARLADMGWWWALFILATGALSLLLQRVVEAKLSSSRAPLSVLRSARIAIIVLTLLLSFVVGANTFGFIIAFYRTSSYLGTAILVLCIAIPALLLSRRSIEKVAYRFYRLRLSNTISTLAVSIAIIEAATLLGVPLPASLTTTTAIYFAGLVARYRYINARTYAQYVAVQCIAIPTALGLGYALSLALGC